MRCVASVTGAGCGVVKGCYKVCSKGMSAGDTYGAESAGDARSCVSSGEV